MGCDIHIVIETKLPSFDKWIGVWASNGPWTTQYEKRDNTHPFELLHNRNYAFFAAVANVRGDGGVDALGMPADASDMATAMSNDWAGDGHSHSYMPLRDFIAAKLRVQLNVPELMRKKIEGQDPVLEYLRPFFYLDDDYLDKSRAVYWFDN